MELINYCLVLGSVFGMVVAVSPGAFRNLNRKINLIKTTFQRDLDSQRATFQREIDDLKYEVLDLKTELHIEKTKTARLQELLNGTDTSEVTVANEDKASRPVDSEILQQHDRQLNQLNESIQDLEIDIADNKRAAQIAKELQQEMAMCTTLRKAFQEEKKHNQQRRKHIMTQGTIDRNMNPLLNVEITKMRNEMEVLSEQVANYTVDIATLRNDLTDQGQSINEALHETLWKFRQQSRLSSEIAGNVQTILQNLAMVNATVTEVIGNLTELQTIVENEINDTTNIEKKRNTTDFSLGGKRARCLEAIRAGGEAMAKLLYVGVTVRRGKDWKWRNQDDKGLGKVTVLPDNRNATWVSVRWDNGHSNNYRMGVEDAYDLMIVEEKFDFFRCK